VSGIQFFCADPAAAWPSVKRQGGTISDELWSMKRGTTTTIRAVIADADGNEFLLSSAL